MQSLDTTFIPNTVVRTTLTQEVPAKFAFIQATIARIIVSPAVAGLNGDRREEVGAQFISLERCKPVNFLIIGRDTITLFSSPDITRSMRFNATHIATSWPSIKVDPYVHSDSSKSCRWTSGGYKWMRTRAERHSHIYSHRCDRLHVPRDRTKCLRPVHPTIKI
jgi:hypothetical protein